MDFSVAPPEINSGRMYAGPGAGPMLAAAAAWERLADELSSAAAEYESVITALTGQQWSGPAAEAMTAATTPFATWLSATAGQAEQAAAQMMTAVTAFEETHAAVVPPPMIAANRSQLASLVAANVFGQNSGAIAAVEAEYAEMWLLDAAVMYGYATRSAAAATVTPFNAPPSTTNPAGSLGQTAEATQSGAGGAHSQLSQLISAMPQALRGLGGMPGSPASLADVSAPAQSPPELPSFPQFVSYFGTAARSILPANDANITALYGMGQFARNLNTDLDFAAAGKPAVPAGMPSNALTSAPTGLPSAAPAVSARVGNAGAVGKLAVPAGWEEINPELTAKATALPGTSPAAAPTAVPGGPTDLFADMAVAGLAGGAIAGNSVRGRASSQKNPEAGDHVERLASELTGTQEVQHWYADPNESESVFTKLSRRPGVHTVHLKTDDQSDGRTRPRAD